MLVVLMLFAQTLVAPQQIVDPSQVRLDAVQQGTRISPDQLSDGRHVVPLAAVPWMRPRWPGANDATRVVCFRTFVRVGLAPGAVGTPQNEATEFCFGAADQQTWLSDPANAMWFGGQP